MEVTAVDFNAEELRSRVMQRKSEVLLGINSLYSVGNILRVPEGRIKFGVEKSVTIGV
jgi:hypothetical protein